MAALYNLHHIVAGIDEFLIHISVRVTLSVLEQVNVCYKIQPDLHKRIENIVQSISAFLYVFTLFTSKRID